jgi:hypothetical protein
MKKLEKKLKNLKKNYQKKPKNNLKKKGMMKVLSMIIFYLELL